VELLLEGGGKVCGHLSNGVARGVAYSGMLRERRGKREKEREKGKNGRKKSKTIMTG